MYDILALDAFNFAFRRWNDIAYKDVATHSNHIINCILKDVLPIAAKTYIVFDPITKDNDSTLEGLSERQLELPAYKAYRKYPKEFAKVIYYVYCYFKIQSSNDKTIITLMKSGYEADDLAHLLLNDPAHKDLKKCFMTTDADWCRDLKVADKLLFADAEPYTEADWINEYDFIPTEASLGLFKAFYGDKSDNIPKALTSQANLATLAFTIVQLCGKENWPTEQAKQLLDSCSNGSSGIQPEDSLDDPIVALKILLVSSCNNKIALQAATNFEVIICKQGDWTKAKRSLDGSSLDAELILRKLGRITKKKKKFKAISV